jgi:hypothetical protein
MTKLCLGIFLFAGLAPVIGFAQTHPASTRYQTAMILRVEKHKDSSPTYMGGDTPTDAPLQSHYFTFEVSMRTDCEIYQGKYETPFNYFPSVFASNRPLWVRVTKHELYFALPDSQRIRLRIVRHSVDRLLPCARYSDFRS